MEKDLYQKLYMLVKLLDTCVHNLPREHKYAIGQEINRLAWSCVDLFHEANSLPDEEKQPIIRKLSLEFDRLKIRLRFAQEIKIISEKQYNLFQTSYIHTIGNQISGWQKWSLDPQAPENKFQESET